MERDTLGSSRRLQDAEQKFSEELNTYKRIVLDKDRVINSLNQELNEKSDEIMGLKVQYILKHRFNPIMLKRR